MEQVTFLTHFHDKTYRSPLYHKPVGIIGHCGGTADMIGHGYKGQILDTITNALGWPIEMDIIGAGAEWPNGVIFPVNKVRSDPTSIFPVQEYDWAENSLPH
jgi:hypothetical protein